eukprot:CAMPEP_0197642432 /NCGR_PEP_ID=MMETSP1338-20131121/16088_1 /TAXON_ID=43686 ORGANISM="Pelagodinium beii, Strain RCC1491" /NCGR_SAMPLE_ID=MMETSP1338 /ASSEMBLY_ACC=CAM_ASM_000754 /LENGTH=1002 /DNA_ID=CAMNT_0043215547 /DNA_START=226 /DNA_END=3231 /DNA_ORIENTATION=+
MLAGVAFVLLSVCAVALHMIISCGRKCSQRHKDRSNAVRDIHSAPGSREYKTPTSEGSAVSPLLPWEDESTAEVMPAVVPAPSEWLAEDEQPALKDCTGQSLSYASLRSMMQSAAIDELFWDAGLRSSEQRVAVVVPNGTGMAASLLIAMARCTACPLDPNFTEAELTTCLQQLGVVAVVTTDALPTAIAVSKQVGIPIIDAAAFFDSAMPEPSFESSHMLRTTSSDLVLLLFTSGTTGRPKLVPYSWKRLLTGAQIIRKSLLLTASDLCLNCMPLFHIGGISCNLLAVLDAGSCAICTPSAQMETFLSCLATPPRPTWYYASPSIHLAVCKSAENQDGKAENTLRLCRSAAGALPPALAQRLANVLDCKVMPTYGMSECMPIASVPLGWDQYDNPTVGPVIGPELKIVAASDQQAAGSSPQDVARLASGEICVRGPLVMPAYLPIERSNEDATQISSVGQEASDGWFRTGDLGYLDHAGQLYITGRAKDIINRGGETIPPGLIENAMSSLEGIVLAVAFPVKHADLGETVGLALVMEDKRAGPEEFERIFNFCSQVLSAKYQPDLLAIIHESQIPKTSTGKIKRNQMASVLELPAEDDFPVALDATVQPPRKVVMRAMQSLDSLGVIQRKTPQEAAEQRLANSMMWLSILCVMCTHMSLALPAPHFANIHAVIGWFSGHHNMEMLFMLLGHNASNTGATFNKRDAFLIGVFLLWSWPVPGIMSALLWLATGTPVDLAYASTTILWHEIPFLTRWFLVVAVGMKILLIAFRFLKCPLSLQLLCAIIVQTCFAGTIGAIGIAVKAFKYYPLYALAFFHGKDFTSWWWSRNEESQTAPTLLGHVFFRVGCWGAFVILVVASYKADQLLAALIPETVLFNLVATVLFNLVAALQFLCLTAALGKGLPVLSMMGGTRILLLYVTHRFVHVVILHNNTRLFGFPILPSLSQLLDDCSSMGVGFQTIVMAVVAIGIPVLFVLLMESAMFRQGQLLRMIQELIPDTDRW